ncbi:MAG: hypothetical protein IK118_04255, partial [Clostridia bacterium]|nr:hypothetical protein [Clostridia bacterium]
MNAVRNSVKKSLALLLVFAMVFSANLTAFAVNGFSYKHDPLENATVLRDCVADENAIYGFRPNDTGSIKMYADADWTDP